MHRLAELSDLEPVFAIYMDATVVPFLGYDPMPVEAFQPIFRELVESRCFFVYEVSGELAGFYKASRHPGRASHVGYLGSLAVAPKFQGLGVARALRSPRPYASPCLRFGRCPRCLCRRWA